MSDSDNDDYQNEVGSDDENLAENDYEKNLSDDENDSENDTSQEENTLKGENLSDSENEKDEKIPDSESDESQEENSLPEKVVPSLSKMKKMTRFQVQAELEKFGIPIPHVGSGPDGKVMKKDLSALLKRAKLTNKILERPHKEKIITQDVIEEIRKITGGNKVLEKYMTDHGMDITIRAYSLCQEVENQVWVFKPKEDDTFYTRVAKQEKPALYLEPGTLFNEKPNVNPNYERWENRIIGKTQPKKTKNVHLDPTNKFQSKFLEIQNQYIPSNFFEGPPPQKMRNLVVEYYVQLLTELFPVVKTKPTDPETKINVGLKRVEPYKNWETYYKEQLDAWRYSQKFPELLKQINSMVEVQNKIVTPSIDEIIEKFQQSFIFFDQWLLHRGKAPTGNNPFLAANAGNIVGYLDTKNPKTILDMFTMYFLDRPISKRKIAGYGENVAEEIAFMIDNYQVFYPVFQEFISDAGLTEAQFLVIDLEDLEARINNKNQNTSAIKEAVIKNISKNRYLSLDKNLRGYDVFVLVSNAIFSYITNEYRRQTVIPKQDDSKNLFRAKKYLEMLVVKKYTVEQIMMLMDLFLRATLLDELFKKNKITFRKSTPNSQTKKLIKAISLLVPEAKNIQLEKFYSELDDIYLLSNVNTVNFIKANFDNNSIMLAYNNMIHQLKTVLSFHTFNVDDQNELRTLMDSSDMIKFWELLNVFSKMYNVSDIQNVDEKIIEDRTTIINYFREKGIASLIPSIKYLSSFSINVMVQNEFKKLKSTEEEKKLFDEKYFKDLKQKHAEYTKQYKKDVAIEEKIEEKYNKNYQLLESAFNKEFIATGGEVLNKLVKRVPVNRTLSQQLYQEIREFESLVFKRYGKTTLSYLFSALTPSHFLEKGTAFEGNTKELLLKSERERMEKYKIKVGEYAKYLKAKIIIGELKMKNLVDANLAILFPEGFVGNYSTDPKDLRASQVLEEINRLNYQLSFSFITKYINAELLDPTSKILKVSKSFSLFNWNKYVVSPQDKCIMDTGTGYDNTYDDKGNVINGSDRKKILDENLIICLTDGKFSCHNKITLVLDILKKRNNSETGKPYPQDFVKKIRQRYPILFKELAQKLSKNPDYEYFQILTAEDQALIELKIKQELDLKKEEAARLEKKKAREEKDIDNLFNDQVVVEDIVEDLSIAEKNTVAKIILENRANIDSGKFTTRMFAAKLKEKYPELDDNRKELFKKYAETVIKGAQGEVVKTVVEKVPVFKPFKQPAMPRLNTLVNREMDMRIAAKNIIWRCDDVPVGCVEGFIFKNKFIRHGSAYKVSHKKFVPTNTYEFDTLTKNGEEPEIKNTIAFRDFETIEEALQYAVKTNKEYKKLAREETKEPKETKPKKGSKKETDVSAKPIYQLENGLFVDENNFVFNIRFKAVEGVYENKAVRLLTYQEVKKARELKYRVLPLAFMEEKEELLDKVDKKSKNIREILMDFFNKNKKEIEEGKITIKDMRKFYKETGLSYKRKKLAKIFAEWQQTST